MGAARRRNGGPSVLSIPGKRDSLIARFEFVAVLPDAGIACYGSYRGQVWIGCVIFRGLRRICSSVGLCAAVAPF